MLTHLCLARPLEHVAPTELVIGVVAGNYEYPAPTELKTPIYAK